MSRRSLFSMVLAATVASVVSSMARAEFEYDTDYDSEYDNAEISLDVSHDLVLIGVDGNRAEVRVLMFDPAEFSEVPLGGPLGTWEEVLEQLEDMAADVHEYSRSLSSLSRICVFCEDGNDVVLTDPEFPVRLLLVGQGGDDHLEGGAANDFLSGLDGDDDLFGREGVDYLTAGLGFDYLSGGDDDDVLIGDFDEHSDGDRDTLQGDGGNDYFLQFYTVEPYTVRTRTGQLFTLGRRVYEETIVDFTTGDTMDSRRLP